MFISRNLTLTLTSTITFFFIIGILNSDMNPVLSIINPFLAAVAIYLWISVILFTYILNGGEINLMRNLSNSKQKLLPKGIYVLAWGWFNNWYIATVYNNFQTVRKTNEAISVYIKISLGDQADFCKWFCKMYSGLAIPELTYSKDLIFTAFFDKHAKEIGTLISQNMSGGVIAYTYEEKDTVLVEWSTK